MNNIVAFGDWHGNTPCAMQAITHVLKRHPDAHLMHVGDFGFWDTNITDARGNLRGFVAKINDLLGKHNTKLHVMLGNHDNYWAVQNVYGYKALYNNDTVHIDGVFSDPVPVINEEITSHLYIPGDEITDENAYKYMYMTDQGFLTSELFPNILVIPRGCVWRVNNITCASLGGGGSVDLSIRLRGRDWWEEEAVSAEQVDRFVSMVEHSPYPDVDVMFTHDLPRCVVEDITRDWEPLRLPRDVQHYTESIQRNIDNAVRRINPALLVGGHMHTRYSGVMDNGTKVEVLNRDGSPVRENYLAI